MNNVNVSGPIQPTATYKTKVLKGNHSFASQVTEPNMKYVIKHDFVLDGDITIPENCVLEFDGGSISNGTLVGNKTLLRGNIIIPLTLFLTGTWKNLDFEAKWFNLPQNEGTQNLKSCAVELQHAIDCIPENSVLYIDRGNYYIDKTIKIRTHGLTLKGYSSSYFKKTFVNYDKNTDIVLFEILAHNVTFNNVDLHAGYAEEGHDDNTHHTAIRVGFGDIEDGEEEKFVVDSFKLTSCAINFFNKGVEITTNNVQIESSTISVCRYGVYLSNEYKLYFNRNIYINNCFLHNCTTSIYAESKQTETELTLSPWRCVTVTGCDINNPVKEILHGEGLQNFIFDSNNQMQIAEDNLLLFDMVRCSQVLIQNNAFLNVSANTAQIFNLNNTNEFININNNSFSGFKKRFANIECLAIITNNIIRHSSNESESTIRLTSKCLLNNNYIIGFGTDVTSGGAVQVSSQYPTIGTNLIEGYDNDYVTSNEIKVKTLFFKGQNDSLRVLLSGLTSDCEGFITYNKTAQKIGVWDGTDYRYNGFKSYIKASTTANRPTLDNSEAGFPLYDYDLRKPIVWGGGNWRDANGFSASPNKGTTANRPRLISDGGTLNASSDIGYCYFDTELSKPIYFKEANGNNIVWVDATGATV